jgi:non-specific serine/threonine protein kinase
LTTRSYRFGQFELRPVTRELLADGQPVALGARAFDVLHALIERRERLVTKEELLDLVWPGVVVEENNLQVQVSVLRKILGPSAIATIPGRGYRFADEAAHGPEQLQPSATVAKHNLPQQLTSFIGRERELVEVRHLLEQTRLLTLLGVGGIGKTRLALQVGADSIDDFVDGVWFVQLAPLTDERLVPQAVATVLGLKEQPGIAITDTLTKETRDRKLLLVLDNCEHLIHASALLCEALLAACAGIRIVATSREPLRAPGEIGYRVSSLATPDPKAPASVEVLTQYAAVQLFIERAMSVRASFQVNTTNAPALASISYHLDGIPLAIELAAARLRSLSVEEVNARLDQRFGLLTGGSRTALPRQQTLRSAIDWSYDLLSDAEKALLCRVSVFSGGWTLAAAEQVCVGEDVHDSDVLDLLTSLVDKSLVVTEERNGATRYLMLETVRQYARDRLQEGGADAPWRGRHLAYFLALAEDAEPQLTGPDQQAWLGRLETEHDNVLSALAWSCGAGGDAVGGLRLAGAFSALWHVRGHLSEGRSWLSRLLAVAPSGEAAAARANALAAAGALAREQDDFPAAQALHQASLALRRELGDRRGIAQSLGSLGFVALAQGDHAAARLLYEESLVIWQELGDRRRIAGALGDLGYLYRVLGDYPAARILFEEGLALSRELGGPRLTGMWLSNLGAVDYHQGDYASAQARLKESLALFRELGDRRNVKWTLLELGNVARERGDDQAAKAHYAGSLAISQELSSRAGICEALEGIANVAFALAEPGRAARIWGWAERVREEIGVPLTPAELPRHDAQVAAARAAMGDDAAFDRAWQEGCAMTLEKIVESALKNVEA